MESGYNNPPNLGTEERVTINELVDTICEVAGKALRMTTISSIRKGSGDAIATIPNLETS